MGRKSVQKAVRISVLRSMTVTMVPMMSMMSMMSLMSMKSMMSMIGTTLTWQWDSWHWSHWSHWGHWWHRSHGIWLAFKGDHRDHGISISWKVGHPVRASAKVELSVVLAIDGNLKKKVNEELVLLGGHQNSPCNDWCQTAEALQIPGQQQMEIPLDALLCPTVPWLVYCGPPLVLALWCLNEEPGHLLG